MTAAMTSAVPFDATDVELIDTVTVDPVGASSATLSQAAVATVRANRESQVEVRDTAGTSKYSRRMGLGQGNRGYAMAALLVGMSVMAILMSAAMPAWSTFAKREKEAELFWRLGQYARAVGLFQRKYANTFPPNVDILVEQRFLRKKYKDPITGGDFQPIPAGGTQPTPPGQQPTPPGQPPRPGQPSIGIQGVVSKSTATALRVLNGRTKYNEWIVLPVVTAP